MVVVCSGGRSDGRLRRDALRFSSGNAIGLRVVLASIDLVENGRARNSRPDQSVHFLCATSHCAAASSSMARRRGPCITDRKRIRRAAVVHWKLARPACLADRRALYSDFSADLWRMERLEQAVRNSLYAALVPRAHACDFTTGFHGLCSGNGKHKRTHFLLRVRSGDGCNRHSRSQTPITDLKVGSQYAVSRAHENNAALLPKGQVASLGAALNADWRDSREATTITYG